jgi:Tfp pilus assembly protein PilO
VRRLSRLVNIGNIRVRAQNNQTASNTVSAQAVATTYVYIDTPPAAAGAAK